MANSKSKLLEWLSLKPRTAGWSAVVAYNRDKCNSLLLQDYINKFTAGSYLPPINKPIPTGGANWEHLSDWVTDVPRLLFDKSSEVGGGSVNMIQAVVGGTQVSIDNVPGHKRAIAIKSIDALDHPELIAENVLLSKTSGTVGKDTGEVVLDLGDPKTAGGMWELTFANTQHERREGGKFFKQYYKDADKEKRLYHLGKIAYTSQQFLKPASFIVRTTTAPGAGVRTAENFADGAVELFICMEGENEGGTPPSDDWKMLIPDDVDKQYDCTVLINNSIVMRKGVYPGALLPTETDINLEEVTDSSGLITGFRTRDSSNRTLHFKMDKITVGSRYVDPYYGIYTSLGDGNYKVSLVREGANFGTISVSWNNDYDVIPLSINGEANKYSDVKFHRALDAYYQYQIDPVTGVATFVALDSSITADFEDVNLTRWFDAAEIKTILENLSVQTIAHNKRVLQFISDSAKSLDVFVVNSILFSNNNTVRLEDGSIPGDLAFFGKFTNPFTIAPLEHLMGHSATHTFNVSNDFTGKVQWSVAAIPGSSGGIGHIDEDSGLYTAPAIGEIDGTFTRVRVTATDPISHYSSSGLITVVVRDITINPVVQICNATTDEETFTRSLSANTLGEGILEWRVSRGNGHIPSRADADGRITYTAPPLDNDLEPSFTVEEIEVKNLATDKTQNAYIVVAHFSQELKVTIDLENSSLPDGKAKLIAKDNRNRVVEAIWKVAEGNGSIDSDGLFTGDPDGQHRFALVTAHTESGGYIDKDGWIILPWPLFELPDKPDDDFMSE